jgi:hypothetical protein
MRSMLQKNHSEKLRVTIARTRDQEAVRSMRCNHYTCDGDVSCVSALLHNNSNTAKGGVGMEGKEEGGQVHHCA